MRTRSAFLSLLVCLAFACGGCASHRPSLFGERPIKEGAPPVQIVKALAAADAREFEAYVERVKRLAVAARPRPADNALPSVESRSPELMAALRRVELMPSAENHRLVGEAYRAAGVLDAAHQHLSRAVKLDPSDARAFDGLARIWRDWGQPELGFGDVSRALFYAPKSAEAYNTLGTLFQALGRRQEARTAYTKAIALDPHASYALNNLCYLSFLDGNGRAALGECQSALSQEPDSAPMRNNLGLIYASLGDLQSARREFSASGHTARAAYNMGITEFALGHYTDAAAAFQHALDDDPTLYRARQHAVEARRRAADQHEDIQQ